MVCLEEYMTEFGMKVASKGCTEGRQIISTGRGGGRGIHAEKA